MAKQGLSQVLGRRLIVNSGILFYLYLTDVSVTILGTNIVETPEVSGYRSAVHFILFLLCLYFGFIKAPATDARV